MPNRSCPPGSNRGANGNCYKPCPGGEPRNAAGKCDEGNVGGLYSGAGSLNGRKTMSVKVGGRRTRRTRSRKNRRTRRR
jgi:hypothetical protein